MNSSEEIAVAALLQSSKGIYKERQLVLSWRRRGKRKACKRISPDGLEERENNVGKRPFPWNTHERDERWESLSNVSSFRVSLLPVPKFWETQKFAKVQDTYFTFAIQNARLKKDLNKYQQTHECLQVENFLLKNECPKIKKVDNDDIVNAEKDKEFKGQ